MITIKINSSNIQEIKKSTPQYREASKTKVSNKKPLDKLFDGKPRIAKVIDITIPKFLADYDVVNEFSKVVVNSSEKSLKSYANVYDDMVNKYSPNDPLYAEYQEIVDVENERRRRLRKEPFVKLINNLMADKGKDAVSGIITSLLGTYTAMGLTIDLDKKLISSAKEVPNPKSPTGKSPAPRNNFLKFLEMHKQASLELEQVAEQYYAQNPTAERTQTNIADDYTNHINSQSMNSYFNNANTPQIVYYYNSLPPKCQKLIDEVIRLTVRADKDVSPYLVSTLLSAYGTDYLRSQQIDAVSELLNRFAYKLVTSKKSDKMTMLFTRVPLEVVRMSDFPHMNSCHAVGGEFSSCATQESISEAGSVIYLLGTPLDSSKISYVESTTKEVLKDDERGIRGFFPKSRIRLRTYLYDNSIYLSVPQSNIYGETYISFYEEAVKFAKDKQASEISQIVSSLQDPSNRAYFKLMGGGYSEGNIEAELAQFLGVEERLVTVDEREYGEEFDVNLPSDQDISDDYMRVARRILKKYNVDVNIVKIYVNAEVYTASGTGYASGESEPDPDPDYTVKAEVTPNCTLKDLFNKMLNKNISHTTFINKNDVDDYMNKNYKYFISSKEFKDLIADIKSKNKKFVFSDDSTQLLLFRNYTDPDPHYVEAELENQIKTFSLIIDKIADPNNYPELLKDIQNTYGESDEEETLNEMKYLFKRLMGR